ncbi:MAG: hypothetical protein HY901_03975 [Deltaproteobacteria bacterium]|nr:hypothetical protein [Deltaproteobacteria bacterium]
MAVARPSLENEFSSAESLRQLRDWLEQELSPRPLPTKEVLEGLLPGNLDLKQVEATLIEAAGPPDYAVLDFFLDRALRRDYDLDSMEPSSAEALADVLDLWTIVSGALGQIDFARKHAEQALKATSERRKRQHVLFTLAAACLAANRADESPDVRIGMALSALRRAKRMGAPAHLLAHNRGSVELIAGAWSAFSVGRRMRHLRRAVRLLKQASDSPDLEPEQREKVAIEVGQATAAWAELRKLPWHVRWLG